MSGLGLGDYASSDEDEITSSAPIKAKSSQPTAVAPEGNDRGDINSKEMVITRQERHKPLETQPQTSTPPTELFSRNGSSIGPFLDPSAQQAGPETNPETIATSTSSPYASSRLMIRDLTMPPIPNFDIPDSPPESPSPRATAKITKFLELKKKAVHFNEKLQTSSALRNPGLLQKLMEFAGVSHEDQYATALPQHLAVPTRYPDWAYADQLNKSQERISKKRETASAQRESVEFVSASNANKAKSARISTAERVLTGLDGEQPRSSGRERSRSPRRKKSRFDR